MRGKRPLYFLQCPKVVADHPLPHNYPTTRHDLGRRTPSALRGGPTMETGRGQGSFFTSLKARTTSEPRFSLLAIFQGAKRCEKIPKTRKFESSKT